MERLFEALKTFWSTNPIPDRILAVSQRNECRCHATTR
jgi:hypothetical protein